MLTAFLLLKSNQDQVGVRVSPALPFSNGYRVLYKKFPKHPAGVITFSAWQLLAPARPSQELRAPKARPAFTLLC